jgi:hypothetical protein
VGTRGENGSKDDEMEPFDDGKLDLGVGHARLRVYTPATGAAPGGGWPVLVFTPGGGL